jgi:hypothetical protein
MRNRSGWILILACALMACGLAPLRAQTPDKSKDESEAIEGMAQESLGWYQVFSDTRARESMTPHPVLRWRNPTRGTQEAEGVFVLWVDKGRPEASASIYPWEGNLTHDFASLSRSAQLVARQQGRVVWSPQSPGVEFHDMPGAAAPADTAAARLKQMKAFADRFNVTMTGGKADKSDREELRLLPKPLYRYELSQAVGMQPNLIDGGVMLRARDRPGGDRDAGSR